MIDSDLKVDPNILEINVVVSTQADPCGVPDDFLQVQGREWLPHNRRPYR